MRILQEYSVPLYREVEVIDENGDVVFEKEEMAVIIPEVKSPSEPFVYITRHHGMYLEGRVIALEGATKKEAMEVGWDLESVVGEHTPEH